MTYLRSLHAWRYALLCTTAIYWFMPDSLFREAHDFGSQLIVVAPVVNAVMLVPLIVGIDLIATTVRFKRKTIDKAACTARSIWAALAIANSVLIVCFG